MGRRGRTGWHRLAGLHTEGNDVRDLEVDGIADADAVAEPIVLDVELRTLNAQHLTDQWREPGHRSTQLTTEQLHELVELCVGGALVDKHPDPPVGSAARTGDT